MALCRSPVWREVEGACAGLEGQMVPIHLHSKVTAVGTLELSCLSRDGNAPLETGIQRSRAG